MLRKVLLFAVLSAGMSGAAMAKVVWRGDFETGDRSQFSSSQMVDASRLQVVSSPVRKGKKALRVEVRNGDDPISASGHRNELVYFDSAREGTEYFYSWSTLLPKDYPLSAAWQVLIQWHHPGCCGAPPVRMVLGCSSGDCGQALPQTLFFIVDGKTLWKLPEFPVGSWQDFILHVKWSANRSVGFVELWHNGKRVLAKTMTRTLFASGDVNYLKLGLYRDVSIAKTGVLFHDQVTQTTTFEEALAALQSDSSTNVPPAPPPTTDAGTSSVQDGGTPEPGPAPMTPPQDASDAPAPQQGEVVEDLRAQGCQSTSGSSVLAWALLPGLLYSVRRKRISV